MAGVERSIEIRAPIGRVHERWLDWASGSGSGGPAGETVEAVGMLRLEPLDENTTRVRLGLDDGTAERIDRFLHALKRKCEQA